MSKQKAHQKLNQLTAVLMMAAAAALAAPAVQAGAGPSGPGYTYEVPGQLGAVAVNPYKIAPLTAYPILKGCRNVYSTPEYICRHNPVYLPDRQTNIMTDIATTQFLYNHTIRSHASHISINSDLSE